MPELFPKDQFYHRAAANAKDDALELGVYATEEEVLSEAATLRAQAADQVTGDSLKDITTTPE